MACNVRIDESRLYRHIYPSASAELQWEIRIPTDTQRSEEDGSKRQVTVVAQVHAPPENPLLSILDDDPEMENQSQQSILIELSLDIPFTPSQVHAEEGQKTPQVKPSKRRNKKYKVKVTDAPETDVDMGPLSVSDTSPEEEDQGEGLSSQNSEISYRSLELSDCSLPSSQEGTYVSPNTPPRLQQEEKLQERHLHNVSVERTSLPPPPVQIAPVPEPINFQTESTPSTLAGQFLFPLRIPDLANKHDLFEHPHPDAPKTTREALNRPDAILWRKAMDEELKSMKDLQVWEEVPRFSVPSGSKLLPWKWVFTFKDHIKPKARLVIIGSPDTEHYDIADTFSPVAPPYVIRWFLAYTHKHNYDVSQIDIRTAFLHSTLPNARYAFIPQGVYRYKTRRRY